MVHERTISKALFGGIGEIMILSSAFLIGLALIEISPNFSITLLMIFGLMFIGIIFRNFENELLGDLLSGKIWKRLFRWVTK